MVTRYTFVRLSVGCRAQAASIAERVRSSLTARGGWSQCQVGVPADSHAGKGWDLCVVLAFDSSAAATAFGGYDKPDEAFEHWAGDGVFVDVVKSWNFETQPA